MSSKSKLKHLIKQLLPPVIYKFFKKNKKVYKPKAAVSTDSINKEKLDSTKQDLDLYWDEDFAKVLEEWGEDNAWNEIQLLLVNCSGKVLDIACGTGITIKKLLKYPKLDLYGFDISDVLIQKAIEKKINPEKLRVEDATNTNYSDNEFDYSFSIGSLEHFTEDGINKFLEECSRYTKSASFHMIPVSRNGENNGWIKTTQSYFNNSEDWWESKFNTHFKHVFSITSKWEDSLSLGKWYICKN